MSEKKSPAISRKQLVRVVKWLIAIAVAAGLVVAIQSAIKQWNAESQKLRQQIAELDETIEAEAVGVSRQELIRERDRLESSGDRGGQLVAADPSRRRSEARRGDACTHASRWRDERLPLVVDRPRR